MKTIVLDYFDGGWSYHTFDQAFCFNPMIEMQKWLDTIELKDTDLRICWPVGMSDPYVVYSKGSAKIVLGEKIGFLLSHEPVYAIKSITLDSKELPVDRFTQLLPTDKLYSWY